jgi:hypothetical protein
MSTPPHEPPPPGAHAGPPGEQPPAEPQCPRCGAPHDPLQEYCLECGLRLVPLPRGGYTRSVVWSRESPVWLWIALGALLLVALAAGAIVALAATDDDKDAGGGVSSLTSPTGEPTTISINTFTTPSTLTIPTIPTVPTTTTSSTTTSSTTTTSPTTTGSGTIISWPSGKNGYTVIIQSTPTSQGRGPADSTARAAIDKGLPQVGVLNSSDYSSLNPGFYVTFTGIYDTQQQAASALPNARSKGYPTAYVRRIAD